MNNKKRLLIIVFSILFGFLIVNAADTASVTATVTVQNLGISLTTDGTVAYGTLGSNASMSTIAGEANDMQTAQNDSNITAKFNIKGQDSGAWELADTTSSDQYVHQFCNDTADDCSTPPTNYSPMNEESYTTLAASVSPSGTVDFQLRVTTPNPSTVFTQQSIDVTIQVAVP
jgi:hypothetical protein